jgi:hypothetical protein
MQYTRRRSFVGDASMRNTVRFLLENSLFLIIGAALGLVWANIDPEGYEQLKHLNLFGGGYGARAERMIERLLAAT